MPVISQEGVYVMGTYGFPVTCQLSAPQPDIFANVSTLKLDLTRPNGSKIAQRTLPLPDSIIDPDRTIQFIVQDGDLPVDGIYTMKFSVDYSGGAHLNFGGSFKVT